MKIGLGLTITLIITAIVQLCAIVYAAYLVRRTKYSVIWILCIVSFAISIAQHIALLFSGERYDMSYELYVVLDVVISACFVVAVLFAHQLVNHIEHLTYERSLFRKRLLSAVLRTEERSRSNFAKELHDGMGPLLSSAKMSLSAISTENMSEEQQQILQNSRFLIDESIRSVREISNNMSPHILTDFGLAQGVRNFASRISQLHTTDIEFFTNIGKERFDNDTEVVLYRVICELINNSLKHSGCSKIEISLMLNKTTLSLEYRDNGCGFNMGDVGQTGMGLSNIFSRIDTLNGEIKIKSDKGGGMRASVHIDTVPAENKSKRERTK